MSAKWALFFDVDKCTGCQNCFVAVKDEYVGNERAGYFAAQPATGHVWFGVKHRERGPAPFTNVAYVLETCQHCDDAPCMKAAANGAVTKRPDGIVIIDPQKARGQKQIVDACPYGAVSWNEHSQTPQAWPFDAHLLDEAWRRTRGEQVCVTGALVSIKIDDAAFEDKKREGWRELRPDLGTKARVLYKGLERLETIFVVGSLETERGGVTDCLEGAQVELVRDGVVLASATSDGFGDFKIDGLAPGGEAMLRISTASGAHDEIPVVLDRCVSIGRRIVPAT
ncbi:MAG: oxidoreductase [Rhodoblastus sp.]|nr:oxidoreductase [Rhodoblastus sp.]